MYYREVSAHIQLSVNQRRRMEEFEIAHRLQTRNATQQQALVVGK